MTVVVYTDASHCEKNCIGACGFVAFVSRQMIKHRITILGNVKSVFLCEFTAITGALQYSFLLNDVTKIVIHSDCLAAVMMGNARKSKKKSSFIREFLDTLDEIRNYNVEVVLEHVRAHSSNPMNNFIDKSSRAQLRKFIKNKNYSSSRPGSLL